MDFPKKIQKDLRPSKMCSVFEWFLKKQLEPSWKQDYIIGITN